MKTSFYFVLLFVICFVLLLFRIEFITHNAVIGVSVLVLTFYWIINCNMSSQVSLLYENKLRRINQLTENNHSSNTQKKAKYSRIIRILIITYFALSVSALAWILYRLQIRANDWWIQTDWIGFVIYSLFTCKIVLWQIWLSKGLNHTEKSSATDENHITEYRNHVISSLPKQFKLYQMLNLSFSILSILLGIISVGVSIDLFIGPAVWYELQCVGLACIFYIYGSLSTYFGAKDLISCIHIKSTILQLNTTQTA